jgi:hypothetical protein
LPASLPALGSVSPKAPNNSPFAKGGKYFFFCDSFPNIAIGAVPKLVCAIIVAAVEAHSFPISSIAITSALISIPVPEYF